MDSTKVSIIAVVATLTPLLALSSELGGASNSDPRLQTVECTINEASKKVTVSTPDGKDQEASKTVTVSVPNSTVKFVCQPKYAFDPPVTNEAGGPKVYSDIPCKDTKPLASYCPSAKLEAGGTLKGGVNQPAATLTVPELPVDKTAVFYVQCKPSEDKGSVETKTAEAQAPCVVQVTVNQAPNTGVHICRQPSITVKVPDKNSSVQFSCEQQFRLYPTDPARVFKDDCKTEEPLKNMRRTAPAAAPAPAPGGGRSPRVDGVAPTVYTLEAVEKPPKRKLCYLCAKQEPSDKTAHPPGSYCAIYVESSARARPSGLGFTPLGLILSSVLAVLRLT